MRTTVLLRPLGPVDLNTDVGTSDYHGMKLSFRRRAAEAWLSVTQSINRDTAGTAIQGLSGQPVNKLLDDPYGGREAHPLPESGGLCTAGAGNARQCGLLHGRRPALLDN